jgi:hypothetical protein
VPFTSTENAPPSMRQGRSPSQRRAGTRPPGRGPTPAPAPHQLGPLRRLGRAPRARALSVFHPTTEWAAMRPREPTPTRAARLTAQRRRPETRAPATAERALRTPGAPALSASGSMTMAMTAEPRAPSA